MPAGDIGHCVRHFGGHPASQLAIYPLPNNFGCFSVKVWGLVKADASIRKSLIKVASIRTCPDWPSPPYMIDATTDLRNVTDMTDISVYKYLQVREKKLCPNFLANTDLIQLKVMWTHCFDRCRIVIKNLSLRTKSCTTFAIESSQFIAVTPDFSGQVAQNSKDCWDWHSESCFHFW